MKIQTLSYAAGSGWSNEIDPSFDSSNTLVVAFGAPRFGADPRPTAPARLGGSSFDFSYSAPVGQTAMQLPQ